MHGGSLMPHLRVGLDYGVGTRHAPGVGRYARELTRALAALDSSAASLHLLDIGEGARVLREPALGLAARPAVSARLIGEVPRRAARLLARPLGVEAWFGGLDHFHQVLLPPWPLRSATSSLAVSELPGPGTPSETRLAQTLSEVDQVHVFSRHYREELVRRFGIERERVVQVPVGSDHWLRDLPEHWQPEREERVLVLGAQRYERDPLTVLRGFELLLGSGREARLVFAGRRGPATPELEAAIAASPHSARIELRDDVTERELPSLVARAAALVHLSSHEGTPVTPLEAFAVGTAVVATPLPAFREALGAEAEWLEAADAGERPALLARALERALDSTHGDATDRRRALARAFTWEACARATLQAWQDLARSRC